MRSINKTALFIAPFLAAACGSDVDNPDPDNENEVITTVTLRFAPQGGGAAVEATFKDPDGDGGAAPTVDDISLTAGSTYALTLTFLNELETPAEDITGEISEEDDEHQIFFTGSAVGTALAHSYDDMDANGNPVGLTNTVVASAGMGQLTVTLRHLPPVGDAATKVAGLAEQAATGGVSGLPGDSDASVTFEVTVQ